MKTILSLLTLTLILSGCGTTGGLNGGHLNMDIACPIAQTAASLGSEVAILENPAYRPGFVAGRDDLAALLALQRGNAISPSALTTALQKIPVKQLQGTNSPYQLAINSGGLVLMNIAKSEVIKLDKQGVVTNDLAPLAQCILDGLNATLGPPQQ